MDTNDLIARFQHDPNVLVVPTPFPRLEIIQVDGGQRLIASLSCRDITARVLDPVGAPNPEDRNYPRLQLGITGFSGRFHFEWEARMLPDDMECLAALLLQTAERVRSQNPRLS